MCVCVCVCVCVLCVVCVCGVCVCSVCVCVCVCVCGGVTMPFITYSCLWLLAKTASFVKSHDTHLDQWSYLPPSCVLAFPTKWREVHLTWESLNSIGPDDSVRELPIAAVWQAVVS